MTILDVEPRWRSLVDEILCLHGPRPCRVWAFGSRVRGRARRFSDLDLDLAVDAGGPLTFGDTAPLADAFEESALPWRVDVVDLVTCSPAFRREIQSHAVLVFESGAALEGRVDGNLR